MLLYIILFSAALQSITCDFPWWIQKCPLPDPNANNCLLNSARSAMWHAILGDPTIGLENYGTLLFNNDILILEYNFQTNHSEMQINGEMTIYNDTILNEARINFNWPNWYFVMSGSLMTSFFDFTLNIYDESSTIQAKGQISLTQDNWKFTYNGDYVKQQIGNEIFMQISWGYGYSEDDTFDVNYIGLSTLDDEPITGAQLVRVKKALRNFESSFRGKLNDFGGKIFTDALNTILKLEPESEIFIPAPNQCPTND